MRFRFCLVLSCVAVLAAAAPAVHAQGTKPRAIVTVDRIIAVVNDEIITQKELAARVDFALRQLRQQGTPPPPREVIERQLLERLIGDRVQMQHARDIGLRVDNAELDKAMERIAADNKLSVAQMRATLQRDGVPFDKFREDIRSEITLARLREREVAQKIVITESEIDNFIQNQQAQPGQGDEFNVSHILVSVPENASPEQLQARRARAEEALAQIRGGADFRQVAAAFSDAPEALQGGLLGWRKSDRLPTLFLDALRALQAGQLSELLRSPNGFHILRLNERRGGQAPIMVQQTRARHILIKTNELVSETEARNRMLVLKERLDNKADFAELARAHSEDTSASRGGDLGWLNPGDTVPEFEQAMNALKPGQISAPVRSPFGWHIIEVMERRTQDMTREGQRMNARQALRERKTDEAYQEWVRQLRDRAYIERRLDEG
ncbi:MAG: peptidylprolyl isomerase [Burkholderiales bacterium]|nr:peptidylprolyl isomerase [Burkholderiales bacterium]